MEEHLRDTQEVRGSSPRSPTSQRATARDAFDALWRGHFAVMDLYSAQRLMQDILHLPTCKTVEQLDEDQCRRLATEIGALTYTDVLVWRENRATVPP